MLAITKWGVFIPSSSFSVHLLMNFDKGYFMSQGGAHYTVEQIVIRQHTLQLLFLTLLHLIVKVIPLLRASKNSGKQGKAQQRRRRWGRAKSRIMVKRSFLIGLPWHSTALINSSSQLYVSLKIHTHWSAAWTQSNTTWYFDFCALLLAGRMQAIDEETNNQSEHYKILILGSWYRLQGFAVMRTKPCAQLNTIHQNHGSFSSLIFFIGGYQFQGMSHSELHTFKKTLVFSIVRSDSCSTSNC